MSGKEIVERTAVLAGAQVGGAAGGAAIGVATANIAAASAATAASASAASAAVAASPLAGTIFAPFAVAAKATLVHPSTWALIASNPVGQAALVAGGTVVGAYGMYKLVKKILD